MFSQLALQELSPTQWELTVSGAVVNDPPPLGGGFSVKGEKKD